MELLQYVNPLQGTDSIPDRSHGNTLPLIQMPFGMTSWSPQTGGGRWFFHPKAPKLQGIRATHQPSPWISDYGYFMMLPQTGRRFLEAGMRSSVYRPEQTVVKPHYFKTYLGRYETTLELTPTERCAAIRVTYPAGTTGRYIIDLPEGDSYIKIDTANNSVSGYTRANSGGCPEDFAFYFTMTFDHVISEYGFFSKRDIWEGETEKSGDNLGGYVEFEASANPVVNIRLATSFIGIEQAKANLSNEIGDKDFDSILNAGAERWEDMLEAVDIEGATERQLRTFYSCLYRALLFPRMWYEYDTEGKPIHFSPYGKGVQPGVLYADNGFWDTYRTVYSFLSIFQPDRLSEIIEGWVQAYREGGWFPHWSSPGYHNCMIGTHLDNIVPDAYLKGIRNFDAETAYEAMKKDALADNGGYGGYGRNGFEYFNKLGYVPVDKVAHAASRTMDFAFNDFGIATMAKALGKDDDYEFFIKRAYNYKNVFDPEVKMMRGRNADGTWETPFDEFYWGGAFIEGSSWQCGWAVQHDPAGLADLMGGKEALAERLDKMLSLPPVFSTGQYRAEIHEMTEMAVVDFGQYAHSNQPVHHVLYLYTSAAQPWKTQYWVRRVMDELYGPDADGFCGDEDNGEMAAWYVLNAIGFYPLCPGQPEYVFGSPLFKKITLNLTNGKQFVVSAPTNSSDKPYVQKVALNGKDYGNTWISHIDVVNGGEVMFTMGSDSKTDRTYTDKELPFSLSNR